MEFGSPYKQLKRKVNTWCRYTKRLDSYGLGCEHDCKYCYAKGLLSFRGYWGEPKEANLCDIKSKIRNLPAGDIVRIGSMTDCFQPIEQKQRITYRTIMILNQFRIHYLIVTKSDMVADDYYINIYDKKLAHFQITITTTDDKRCFDFENAAPASKRIKAVEKLNNLGFDTSIRLSPFLVGYIDFEIMNSIKCNKILIEFLKVNSFIRKSFNIDYAEYTLKYGGYEHLELDRKVNLLNNITGFDQVSVGEYVSDHHEYFKTNVNHNKNDCCNLDYNYLPDAIQLCL